MIGREQLATMKKGIRIVNCARGGIVDEASLADAILSGHVAGAAFDVFAKEPVDPENPLLQVPQCVVTPHLGASTEEAQVNVAIDIAEQIVDVLRGKPARAAVNMPSLSADALVQAQPYIELGQKIGSLHTQLARDRSGAGTPIESVEVLFQGDFGSIPTAQITRAVLSGLLTPILSDPVNLVNAPVLAAKRGLQVTESQSTTTTEYSAMLTVKAVYSDGERTICGTILGKNDQRIVHIDGYHVDIVPQGNLVLTQHTDKPGIIGKVGTLLGDRSVNIAGMHVGREKVGGRALMALMVDGAIGEELMERIRAVPGMEKAQQVQL